MFIVFEWVDGAWKDTQLNKTFEYLWQKDKYLQIWKTREPTSNTESWKKIAYKLKNGWFKNAKEALDLYVKDRKEQTIVRKQILKHSVILSSRFDYSTYAYQWTSGFSFEEIYKAHDDYKDILEPDLTFILYLDKKNIEKRLKKRWEKKEFFENIDFLEKVNQKYIQTAQGLKDRRNIYLIDANGDIEETFEKIKIVLNKYF